MASVSESAIASRLLEEAVRLFAVKGYPGTSTREIVEAAGVTKPMLYYYFRNKEGLLSAAIAHFVDPFHARLREVLAQPLAAREQLVELIWAHLAFCQEHKPLARLFFALYFGPDDQKNLIDLRQYTDVGHELVMQAVANAVDQGLVSAAIAEEFSVAVHGMINIWVIASLQDDVELSYPLAARIVDTLLGGFCNP